MNNNNICPTMKDLDWLHIPGTDFLMKYKFFEDGFSVLVSNLKQIFGENLNETEIQEKFSNCNPHAEMKTKVIFKNLKQSVKSMLENKDSTAEIKCSKEKLNIELQFNVNQVSFIFDLEPVLLPSQKFQSYVTVPVLSHALLTQQENVALKKKVKELESKLNSAVSPQKPLFDYKTSSNALNLFENNNVSESLILDAFLEVQSGIKECSNERKELIELHRKRQLQASSHQQPNAQNVSVKREIKELLEPSEIKYDDDVKEGCSNKVDNKSTLPVVQTTKTKKKKNLKF